MPAGYNAEIGRVPRRDRSASAARSVVIRIEIGSSARCSTTAATRRKDPHRREAEGRRKKDVGPESASRRECRSRRLEVEPGARHGPTPPPQYRRVAVRRKSVSRPPSSRATAAPTPRLAQTRPDRAAPGHADDDGAATSAPGSRPSAERAIRRVAPPRKPPTERALRVGHVRPGAYSSSGASRR